MIPPQPPSEEMSTIRRPLLVSLANRHSLSHHGDCFVWRTTLPNTCLVIATSPSPLNCAIGRGRLSTDSPLCLKNVLKGPKPLRGYGQRPKERSADTRGLPRLWDKFQTSSNNIHSRHPGPSLDVVSLVMPCLLQNQPGYHSYHSRHPSW